MSFERDPFKCFVSIEKTIDESIINQMMTQHIGYPIDNVVQIKLSKDSFTKLFKSSAINSSSVNIEERYNSPELLNKLQTFFSSQYNNYNSIASDITILISNTYADKIDINPVNLENACKPNGQIFDYFFLSECTYLYSSSAENYDDTTSNPGKMKVFQAIAREIDNMITRDISSDETTSLEELYSLHNDNFWNNLVEGDSIFIDGSFNIPGDYNVPIIIQFLNMDKDIGYSFTSEINGSALDGYIANGNVKVFNLKDKLIYQTTTNEIGDFSIINIDPPFIVQISEGTDIATNEPNDLILTSLKMNNKDNLTVTPITSMLVDTFEEQGLELTEENLTSVKITVASKMGIYEQNIYEDFISTNNSDLASKALQFAHLYRVTTSLGIQNEKQIQKKIVSKILENNLETVATDPTTINSLITDIYDDLDPTNTNRTEITTNAVEIIKTVNENYKNSENNLADLYKISKGYQNNNSIIKNGIIDHTQSTENISTSIQNSIEQIPIEAIYKLTQTDVNKEPPLIIEKTGIPQDNLTLHLDSNDYSLDNNIWYDSSQNNNNITFNYNPIINSDNSLHFNKTDYVSVDKNIKDIQIDADIYRTEQTLIYIMRFKEFMEIGNETWLRILPGGFGILKNYNSTLITVRGYHRDSFPTEECWDFSTYFSDTDKKEKFFMVVATQKHVMGYNVRSGGLFPTPLAPQIPYSTIVNYKLYDSYNNLLIDINDDNNTYNFQFDSYSNPTITIPTIFNWDKSTTIKNIVKDNYSKIDLKAVLYYNKSLTDNDLENIRDYYLLNKINKIYEQVSTKSISNIQSNNITINLLSINDPVSIIRSDNNNSYIISQYSAKGISKNCEIAIYNNYYTYNNAVYISNIKNNTVQEIKNILKINFGCVAAISGDGLVVAIGHGTYKNSIDIYKYIQGTWTFNYTISGFTTTHTIMKIKLNYDGSVLLISIKNPNATSNTNTATYIHIFKFENNVYSTQHSFYNNHYESEDDLYINDDGNLICFMKNGQYFVKKIINGSWQFYTGYNPNNSNFENYTGAITPVVGQGLFTPVTRSFGREFRGTHNLFMNDNIFFQYNKRNKQFNIYSYHKEHKQFENIYYYQNIINSTPGYSNILNGNGLKAVDISNDGKILILGFWEYIDSIKYSKIAILLWDNFNFEYVKIKEEIIGEQNEDLFYDFLKIIKDNNVNELKFMTTNKFGQFKFFEIDLSHIFSIQEYQF